MALTGLGLPSAWPSRLFTLTIITQDGLPIPLKVLSASTSKLEVAIPEVLGSTTYNISLKSPIDLTTTAQYIQESASTPAVSIATPSAAISPGLQTVTLTKTALTTRIPTSVAIYNILNQDNLYPVASFTHTSSAISFSHVFKSGRYGVKVWYDGLGWAICNEVINVAFDGNYSLTTFSSSLAGSRVRIESAQIGS